ncbi:hypothetical protein ES703_104856 [subsurface metagenome]
MSSDEMVDVVREITIGGENLSVRPFSVGDLVRFSRDLAKAAGRIVKAYGEAGLDITKTTKEDLFPFIFNELDTVVGFMACAVDKDRDWLLACRDMAGFSVLFKNICELNDFKAVIANFTEGNKYKDKHHYQSHTSAFHILQNEKYDVLLTHYPLYDHNNHKVDKYNHL